MCTISGVDWWTKFATSRFVPTPPGHPDLPQSTPNRPQLTVCLFVLPEYVYLVQLSRNLVVNREFQFVLALFHIFTLSIFSIRIDQFLPKLLSFCHKNIKFHIVIWLFQFEIIWILLTKSRNLLDPVVGIFAPLPLLLANTDTPAEMHRFSFHRIETI